jgi:D-glycero-alpha-D-manno-heptose-7-phosphate kinase|tara:strand:+ start:1842 stop:2852 length:1011 start_codon:yes stop_codon:yes gene_type:complete
MNYPISMMIISRTPVRVSFCGGGTDVDWFSKTSEKGGMVTSLAIDRYIHVIVNRRFDERIRLSYSKLEVVDNFEDLEHELVRESMRITGVTSGVEITTIADIPSRGTGLGSSSAVTVGLLNALHCFAGRNVSASQLASEACEIEIKILGQPIGRQDQYAASFGGINSIRFCPDGNVIVDPINISEKTQLNISDEFTLIFTGQNRSASAVLLNSEEEGKSAIDNLIRIREQADEARNFLSSGELSKLGILLNEAWSMKRGISSNVSNDFLDEMYSRIMSNGANGAKLLGAGGGGFFLVHGDQQLREKLQSEFSSEHRMLPLNIDFNGSSIIFNDSRV